MAHQTQKSEQECEMALRRERELIHQEEEQALRSELQRLREDTQRAVDGLSEQLELERQTVAEQQAAIKVRTAHVHATSHR